MNFSPNTHKPPSFASYSASIGFVPTSDPAAELLKYRRACFSGVVMTVHKYKISPASHIANGLVVVLTPDVREIKAVMGGNKPVSLY